MKIVNPTEIQVHKPVLLSGPVLSFIPALARSCGGDLQGIVYLQLCFLSREMTVGGESAEAKRISFTKLQAQLRFVTRRWLIKVLQSLSNRNIIKVEKSGRVNVYVAKHNLKGLLQTAFDSLPEPYFRSHTVLPTLAEKIGLANAIVLQQIHLRNHKTDGSLYVIRSLDQWHSWTFPFWGIATVKRIFRRLKELNLIFVRSYRREDNGFVNSYRVNYIGVAELLDLPIPKVENPHGPNPQCPWAKKVWEEWTNPVTLIKQIDLVELVPFP